MEILTKRFENVGETLQTAVLDNGLHICVVPKKGFSSFFACFGTYYGSVMRSFDLAGVRHDTPAGVAHYLEHKMFDMPNGDNALQSMTATGADPNAFTAYDETVYYFHCTEHFEENLRTLLRFVTTPYFTAETVEKEQGIIAQEIRMYDDEPDNAVYVDLMKLLYKSHPVRDDIAGTVESIAEIDADTLYACHRAFYTPGNMCLCVAGDVDAAAICAIAEEMLGGEKGEVPQPVVYEENDAPRAGDERLRAAVPARRGLPPDRGRRAARADRRAPCDAAFVRNILAALHPALPRGDLEPQFCLRHRFPGQHGAADRGRREPRPAARL